jgi:aspartate/methionine/tyrosine aminotransferase
LFVYADIRERGVPFLEFVLYLVREAGVVLTNRSGFDHEGFVRISYAAKPEQIERGMKRAVINVPAAALAATIGQWEAM